MPPLSRDSLQKNLAQRLSPQERVVRWRQCEEKLSDLAAHWRDTKNAATAHQYQETLIGMIADGFSEELDGDAELPRHLMPKEYFALFK